MQRTNRKRKYKNGHTNYTSGATCYSYRVISNCQSFTCEFGMDYHICCLNFSQCNVYILTEHFKQSIGNIHHTSKEFPSKQVMHIFEH